MDRTKLRYFAAKAFGSAAKTCSGEISARQGRVAVQTAELPSQPQTPPVKIWCRLPTGAQRAGEVGPKSEMVGTPSPAAKCSGPVSPEIKTRARLSAARKTARSSAGDKAGALGISRVNSASNSRSRGPPPVLKTTEC